MAILRGNSKIEINYCKMEKHCLVFDGPREEGDFSSAVLMNMFIVSLWIAKPTRVFLAYRFVIEEIQSVTRLLQRFEEFKDWGDTEICDADLKTAAGHFNILRETIADSERIKVALLLTLQGCFSSKWQVAFVCFDSAAETLLFYQEGNGLTNRLVHAYAALVSANLKQREVLREDFRRLYEVRCDIVHNGAYKHKDPEKNLGNLLEFCNLLRHLWRVVLTDAQIRTAIAGTNEDRKALLEKIGGLSLQTALQGQGNSS